MKRLRQQAELFYSYFSSGQHDRMWEMLSSRLKRENENDKQKYVSGLPKSGPNHLEAVIQTVKIDGKQASVGLRITIISAAGKEMGFEDHDTSWVLERNRWRFDGYKVTQYKFFEGDRQSYNRD